jgi:hypothetical protein
MELFSELCTAIITFKAVPQRTLSVCLPKIFPRGILEDCRDKGGGVIFETPPHISFDIISGFLLKNFPVK